MIQPTSRLCEYPDCGRKHFAKGLCRSHYMRLTKYGDPAGGVRPVGAEPTYLTAHGYRAITVNGKQIMEHRHFMEQVMGRPLLPHENVHHINGDRADNRIENLELWSTSQPKGQRVADKLAWAREILAEYAGAPPEVTGDKRPPP